MEGEKDLWKMGFPELICIKCEEGENLLVCNENDCLLAVHEECIGCPARYDDEGHFYCPHCFFRQVFRESQEAWKNAMSKKKALAIFEMIGSEKNLGGNGSEAERLDEPEGCVNTGMTTSHDGKSRQEFDVVLNDSVQIDEDARGGIHRHDTAKVSPCRDIDILTIAEKRNTLNLSENVVHNQNDNGPNVTTIKQTNLGPVSKRDKNIRSSSQVEQFKDSELDEAEHADRIDGHKLNKSRGSREEYSSKKDFKDVQDPSSRTMRKTNGKKLRQEHGSSTMEEETGASQSSGGSTWRKIETSDLSDTESEDISLRSKQARLRLNYKKNEEQKFLRKNPPRTALRTTEVSNEKVDTSRGSKQSKKPSTNRVNQIVGGGKRRRLMWNQEEEEMLRQGVQKFSSREKQNLPWRKILEFGRHVFDETRTPSDLKDKWRNHLAK